MVWNGDLTACPFCERELNTFAGVFQHIGRAHPEVSRARRNRTYKLTRAERKMLHKPGVAVNAP